MPVVALGVAKWAIAAMTSESTGLAMDMLSFEQDSDAAATRGDFEGRRLRSNIGKKRARMR